jgi:hypothetical protein
MSKYKPFSVSLSPDATDFVEKRTTAQSGRFTGGVGKSEVVSTGLERYDAILQAGRRELAQMLIDAETAAILDACNGTLFADPHSIRLVWANVEDSIPDGIEAKWGIDAPGLSGKLRSLAYAESVALVDAIERWWRRVGEGEELRGTTEEVFG